MNLLIPTEQSGITVTSLTKASAAACPQVGEVITAPGGAIVPVGIPDTPGAPAVIVTPPKQVTLQPGGGAAAVVRVDA